MHRLLSSSLLFLSITTLGACGAPESLDDFVINTLPSNPLKAEAAHLGNRGYRVPVDRPQHVKTGSIGSTAVLSFWMRLEGLQLAPLDHADIVVLGDSVAQATIRLRVTPRDGGHVVRIGARSLIAGGWKESAIVPVPAVYARYDLEHDVGRNQLILRVDGVEVGTLLDPPQHIGGALHLGITSGARDARTSGHIDFDDVVTGGAFPLPAHWQVTAPGGVYVQLKPVRFSGTEALALHIGEGGGVEGGTLEGERLERRGTMRMNVSTNLDPDGRDITMRYRYVVDTGPREAGPGGGEVMPYEIVSFWAVADDDPLFSTLTVAFGAQGAAALPAFSGTVDVSSFAASEALGQAVIRSRIVATGAAGALYDGWDLQSAHGGTDTPVFPPIDHRPSFRDGFEVPSRDLDRSAWDLWAR